MTTDDHKNKNDIKEEAAGEPANLHTDEEAEPTELPDEVDDVEENIFGSAAEGNDEM